MSGSKPQPPTRHNTDYYVPNPSKRRRHRRGARRVHRRRTSSGSPPKLAGATCRTGPSSRTSASSSTRAMDLIEKENPSLKGVLPKTYARAEIDKRLLGELVDLIGTIGFTQVDHGADDVLGRVYEYFLGRFAASEGRNAGEFYTPRSVVRVLVEMLEPYEGRVFDPCCGSGGMFVQSAEFVAAHGGKRDNLSIYGQEFVATTWRLAKMNLAHPGHRRQSRRPRRRCLPPGPLPGPARRLHPRQPAVQQGRLVLRGTAGRSSLGLWASAGEQRQLCLGAALSLPPCAERHGRLRSRQRQSVNQDRRRRRNPSEARRSRPGRLHRRDARQALLQHRDPGQPLVRRRRTAPTIVHRDRRGTVLFIDARKLGRMETRTVRTLDDA